MRNATYVERAGGLAVAFGIGAGLFTVPVVAEAQPVNDRSVEPSSEVRGNNDQPPGSGARTGIRGLLKPQPASITAPRTSSAAAAPSAQTNRSARTSVIGVSINGKSLIGNSATSSEGSIAVAIGFNSTASATGGTGNLAVAVGNKSTATATGTGNTATVVGSNSTATAAGGSGNTATVRGNRSTAMAGGGNDNTATATGNSSNAYAGISPTATGGYGNNNNTATATNNGRVAGSITASAGVGVNNSNNSAAVTNEGTISGNVTATAGAAGGVPAGANGNNTNNAATITNTGSITGQVNVTAGGSAGNINNSATLINSGSITIIGTTYDLEANDGTATVPVNYVVTNGGDFSIIVIPEPSARTGTCTGSATECVLFAVSGVSAN
jgi:hypothetical protein